MGFDTDDGKGERPILLAIGWYAKPSSENNQIIDPKTTHFTQAFSQ